MKRLIRAWLGIHSIDTRVIELEVTGRLQSKRILEIQDNAMRLGNTVRPQIVELQTITLAHSAKFADVLSLHNDLQSALQEIRQIRETVLDPKKVPIATRNSRQFRALVEQEP